MISMDGVPSALIARNQSWVRQQAHALARRVTANVEKADLIQVGLIAVAQSALTFEWEGDRDSEEARAAFVRYAQARVRGAMLDELRQIDALSRADRRQIKVIEIARERLRAANGAEPRLAEIAAACGLQLDEVSELEHLASLARPASLSGDDDDDGALEHLMPATEKDEVEARVDTAIVLRRLESFFEKLPAGERQVIDAYLGVGLSPVDVAASLNVSPSRVSRIYREVMDRAREQFGWDHPPRTLDRGPATAGVPMDRLTAERESALRTSGGAGGQWAEALEHVLSDPMVADDDGRIRIASGTRWG